MSPLMTFNDPSGLVDLALKSALVSLAAVLVAALLVRASAARRHFVWCLSVASLLLLPGLTLALPAWCVTWLPQLAAGRTQPAQPHPAAVAASLAQVAPVESAAAIAPSAAVLPPSADVSSAAALTAPAETAEPAAPARAAVPWWAIVWVVGALLSLVPLAIGLWQLVALQRHSRAMDDRRWLALLDEVRRQVGVRRRVQLRQHAAAAVPLTWGALFPVLLIPAEAVMWPDERRRLVLLHEVAHVCRWDWLTQLAAHLACALYWFNPLVWLAARQMRIERERACDDLVLASGARASDYAGELLAMAANLTSLQLSALVGVPMARRGALEDRLRGILDARRSRAALTAAAVSIGALLAGATIGPLAMLRAAAPETGEPATTAEDLAAQADTIRITVLNARGDRDIPAFRVIAGVSSGSVASEFEARAGATVINWQPHTCRIGKNGELVWPLAQTYDEFALRVEADGYQPQVVTGIKKSDGRRAFVFQLADDPGVAGRVLTPAGKPAAGATVAMALPHQEIVWQDGKLRGMDEPLPKNPADRWQRPRFIKADAQGAFRLPTEIEPAAVLIVHESGALEIAYDEWQKSPRVKLERWGSIAGQVLWRDKPGADEDVSLTIHRDAYGYPGMIASYARARTDKDGKFTFDRVLPGLVQISRPIKPDGAPNIGEVVLNGMYRHVDVAAGDATPALLGGRGRKVTGKFVGLDSWEGATYHFHPEAPHLGFGGFGDAGPIWKAFDQLRQSPIGPILFRDKQPVNRDGTFSIEDLLPGRYQLFLSAPGFENYAASTAIVVEPEVPGQEPAPLDLKEVVAAKKKEAAPPPIVKPVTIRGKVLDDATGEPIGKFIVQAGKFEPNDPQQVIWGWREERSSGSDGSFSTSVRWNEGWTARILAGGYFPQPLLESAPEADADEMDVTIRLKHVPEKVRGVVLDAEGQPVKDAAVFAMPPSGLYLAAGDAWSRAFPGRKDDSARPVRTDEQGRFELVTGGVTVLGISHARLDAWPAKVPASGKITIRLPEAARVEVDLDIDGADKQGVIFYQLIWPDHMQEFAGVQASRDLKIANPGELVLDALPPGRYQLCRMAGTGAMVERQFFELKSGETKSIRYVREKGARVRGRLIRPPDAIGIVIRVLNEKSETIASQSPAEDGTFLTERIAPGTYNLVAYGFKPLTEQQRFRTGAIAPSFQGEMTIEVPEEIPEDGEVRVKDLILKPIRRK